MLVEHLIFPYPQVMAYALVMQMAHTIRYDRLPDALIQHFLGAVADDSVRRRIVLDHFVAGVDSQ